MLRLQISALVESLPQAAAVIDERDRVVAANQGAAEVFAAGESASALLDTELATLAPDGAQAPTLRRLDGTAFEAEASLSRLDAEHRLFVARDVTAERRVASQLADAERIARVGIWEWHVPSGEVTWSPEAFELFGRDPATTTPSFEIWLESIHPEDREWVNEFVMGAFERRSDYDFEHRVQAPDGTIRHLHCRGQVVLDDEGEPLRLVGASQDVTERVIQQGIVDRIAAQREAVLDAAGEGICGLDLDGKVAFANPSAATMLGLAEEELLGLHISERMADSEGVRLEAAISGGLEIRGQDANLARPDGVVLPVTYHCAPLVDEGVPTGAVLTFADISERRAWEAQLRHLSDHDALTGLLNRHRFEAEVAAQATYADRYGGSLAVLLLDLDHFKDVNDTGGHGPGDELLRSIASLLRGSLTDDAALARLGGDEFAVLLPAADDATAAGTAERLRETIAAHVMLIDGRDLQITASIGVAIGPGASSDAESILADADVAMYQAKDGGRNSVAIYKPELGGRERMQQRLTWSSQVRAAIDGDAFSLFAQPIRDLGAGGSHPRFEILLRLPQADGALAGPSQFLPVAERHGLIRELDRWVVEHSIALAATELAAGRRTILAINLSGRSMGDPKLPGLVSRALSETGALPDQLVFEVTETAAIDNLAEAKELAGALVEMGCSFAIDDFGAGFGSFAYLKHLPADLVKIDGDFVRRLPASPTDQLVVKAIVELAHGMGKRVVAEMVEDQATTELLCSYGADFGQGYHLGRPGPVSEMLGVSAPAV